jgi:UDPglucose--hexose-1-phosphate uridylyltransferase
MLYDFGAIFALKSSSLDVLQTFHGERITMIETGKRQAAADQLDPARPISDHLAESRLDPLTGDWTIFSPDRDRRPDEFIDHRESVNTAIECPFCPGNEPATPPPVWVARISDNDSAIDVLNPSEVKRSMDDWSIRVVPNKYPAVGSVDTLRPACRQTGLFQGRPILGGHEVIIESRQHVQSITELDLAEIQLVFKAYRDRLQHWRGVPGVSYISTFKNVGGKAGASLRHTHSQLIATDRMPAAISSSIKRMVRHRATTGCCLQCDLIRGELKARQRVVWRDDSLIAYCPFASRLPMTVRITTLKHQDCYEDLDEQTIESISRMVVRVVSWLEKLRPGTAYNYCLHTRPPGAPDAPDSFHWSLEVFPRMTSVAGFEWSSQCMINPMLPEDAAAKYRACALAEDPRVLL